LRGSPLLTFTVWNSRRRRETSEKISPGRREVEGKEGGSDLLFQSEEGTDVAQN